MNTFSGNEPEIARSLLTIIVPVYNGASTLNELFKSLETQTEKELIEEILIVDGGSKDASLSIAENYQKNSSYKLRVLQGGGLSKNYNIGIKETASTYFMLIHQDIVITSANAFSKALKPLHNNGQVVATCPMYKIPHELWGSYNFWQKCLLSRHVGNVYPGFGGKFDCYNKGLLLSKVGYFDESNYRTAGEDGDMTRRISEAGLKVTCSGVEILHIHDRDKNFSLKKLFKKEAQLSETYGVYLRRGTTPKKLSDQLLMFFRPLILISLLIPYINYLGILALTTYAFLYTKLVYVEEKRNPRVLTLPFVNIALLVTGALASLKGFISGKQSI